VKLRRATLVPVLLAAGLLVAACGGAASSGTPSATPTAESMAQLLPAMQAAADSAQSVHVAGAVPVGSQTDAIDMSLAAPLSVSGSITQAGNTLTVSVVDGTYYVLITTSFLKFAHISPPDCGTVCGKYVEVPASETSQLDADFTIKRLFQDAFGAIPSSARHSTADVFLPTTYQGRAVLKASIAGDTMVVARGGTPYLLAVSASNGDHVVFSEWNSVPPIKPPPASDVVSLGTLSSI
jgi:hypothetical protein